MNVTVISIFRQATHYLERYFEQMDGLQKALTQCGDSLHLLLGYGDSTDGTGEALFDECAYRFDAHLVDVSHGGKAFGSVEDAQRFKQLAFVGNRLLDQVPPNADVVGIVESDLIWDAKTIVRLIDDIAYVHAVAPMVMDGPDSFYDVFAFRRNSVRFNKKPPYHADLVDFDGDLFKLDSAGSVLVLEGNLARQVRFTEEEAIVGLCKEIYKRGGGGSNWIALDTQASVQHP